MANYLNTRIKLRYDTLENWKSNDPTLLDGELAIVAIPTSSKDLQIEGTTPPQILFKVGPGAFNSLPYASGKAADVYTWAKQEGLSINKDGGGNVVSSITWDATANNGKGGIKFTTAAVATSEGLQDVQDRVKALEEKEDQNTTYTFEEIKDTDENVTGIKITPKGGSAQPISFDFLTEEGLVSYLDNNTITVDALVSQSSISTNTLLAFYDIQGGSIKIVDPDNGSNTATITSTAANKIAVNGKDIATEKFVTDKGYITSAQAPVQSVNGKTGSVVLSADDIKYTHSGLAGRTVGSFGDETLSHITSEQNPHKVTAAQVGAYTKEEANAEYAKYIPLTQKGAKDGVATLGEDGKVPTSQLPGYVDDVVEYNNLASFPTSGESGKIYVAKDTNTVYRWSGTAYIEISASLALGETSATAYAGDKGKTLAEKVAKIETVVQWTDNQPQIIGDEDWGLTIDGKPNLYLKAGYISAEANYIGLDAPEFGIGPSDAPLLKGTTSSDTGDGREVVVDGSFNAYVISGDALDVGGLSAEDGCATVNYLTVNNINFGESHSLNIDEDGHLSFDNNTLAIAADYLPISGGIMTGNINLNSSKLQGTHQGMTRNIAYMDSTDGLHLGEGVLGATIHSYSAPKWTNQQNVTKTLATTDDIPTNVVQYDQKETPDAWFGDANVLIINCGSSKFQN